MTQSSARHKTFRSLHDHGFFIIPNAWDPGSVTRLSKLGFKAIASTSAGAAWAAGREDGDLLRDQILAHLRALVDATEVPVNADFENGFADSPEAVATNVAMAAGTGVSGISIEDWSGSRIYDLDHAMERLAAARQAMDTVAPAVLLIGRHEHFRIPEVSSSAAIARAVAYAAAGADCLFVPMIADPVAIAELVAAVAPKPVNVLVQDHGPAIRDLANLGVRRCSVGGSLARIAWDAFDAAAQTLKAIETSIVPQERSTALH